jgi:hypothetical protein
VGDTSGGCSDGDSCSSNDELELGVFVHESVPFIRGCHYRPCKLCEAKKEETVIDVFSYLAAVRGECLIGHSST